MIGQNIKGLLDDKKLLQTAKNEQMMITKGYTYLKPLCTKKDLDKKVKQFKQKLTEFLNNHAIIIQITDYFK